MSHEHECAYCGNPVPASIDPEHFNCCGEVGHYAFCQDYKPGDPIGYGNTKEAAIQDLKGQL